MLGTRMLPMAGYRVVRLGLNLIVRVGILYFAAAAPGLTAPDPLGEVLGALEDLSASPEAAAKAKPELERRLNELQSELEKLGDEASSARTELENRRRALEFGLALMSKLAPPSAPAGSARGRELFGHKVQPAFNRACAHCHNPEKKKGGLDLSTREAALAGGESGQAFIEGRPEESLIYRLAAHLEEPHMPFGEARLPEDEIAAIREWIAEGAPYVTETADGAPAGRIITDADREAWPFNRLAPVEPPAAQDPAAARTPIDAFLQAKLAEKGLAMNPPAAREKLIRRATLDLIGLPPTPDEIDAFMNDSAPDAYEKVIDRLLASPHFGERWARHWLDVARFAESHGFEHDYDRKYAFYYRDFVIKAMNDDLPFDTFVKWQIAGDEIAPDNPLAMTATGFLGAGVHSTQITKSQVEKERYDELDDMLGTIGTSMLGLTIACARCHDHKYDPIPARDYYQMLSTFTTTVRSELDIPADAETCARAQKAWDAEHAPFLEALKAYDEKELIPAFEKWVAEESVKPGPAVEGAPARAAEILAAVGPVTAEKLSAEQHEELLAAFRTIDPKRRELEKKIEEHAKTAPPPGSVKAMVCSEGTPAIRLHTQGGDFLPETHFLKRGDPNQKLAVAAQGFLQVLSRSGEGAAKWQEAPPEGARTSYRRKSFANWIADPEGGGGALLARVIVNRLWQHHFGRGIVATPSDFGAQGARPTHPELLDWLAAELIRGGWKLKPIHRLMMTSAAYMQSSGVDPGKLAADPENSLLWHFGRRRLEAEALRDSILAVGDQLDRTMFGPGTLDESMKRRSIYFTVKRSRLVPMMTLFDGPDALGGVGVRPETTVAPQALLLMNGELARKSAYGFATRIRAEADTFWVEEIHRAYRIALGRAPTESEVGAASPFILAQVQSYKDEGRSDAEDRGLADFCQALMALNEFAYVD